MKAPLRPFPSPHSHRAAVALTLALTFTSALSVRLLGDVIQISPAVAGISSQLPVLVIDNAGAGPLVKDGPDQAAELNLFKPEGGVTRMAGRLPDHATALTISVRGASSADFPKKSYNVTLRDRTGSKQAQSLLGLPPAEKWALVASWMFDLSYINNSFVYALSNRIGRWAPRTRFVEVFFNTRGGEVDTLDYAGIYVLTERVEVGADRVNISALRSADKSEPAVTGGYVLKIDRVEADDVAWNTARGVPVGGDSAIVLVAPRASDINGAQRDYLGDYVQRVEDALYADRAGKWVQRTSLDYIDRAAWVDHHILNTFACNPDALLRSAYFTKDRGGKLAAGPVWDFDRALGSYWDPRSLGWDVWFGAGATDVWHAGWWGVMAEDPEFIQQWVDRWQSIRAAEFTTSALVQLARDLAAQIGPEAAARDAARWPDNASPFGSHAAQIDRLTGWLELRANWIDGQFVAPATLQRNKGTLTFVAPEGAQLAYTLDGSDPRSLGGDLAPNAMLATGTLTVDAGANVHVRSYRAGDASSTFPGSPWSRALGGDRSSPLTPSARLVSLSSRGRMGVAEDTMIVGVVVADTAAKRYLARAIGPGMVALGVKEAVSDAQLSITGSGAVELDRNADWQNGPAAASLPRLAQTVGAFPLKAGSLDAALVPEFGSGAHALHASSSSGVSGIGMADVYELDTGGRTANLSTRTRLRRGGDALISGMVIRGPAFKRVLIRAVGPALAGLGVANALPDPVLAIYAGANRMAVNDRWSESEDARAIAVAAERVGAFPLAAGSEDAAVLITLPPGAYILEVQGKPEGEGVVLLEIYDVP